MNRPIFYALGFILLVVSSLWVLIPRSPAQEAQAPFLQLPFYGNKTITSYVDHEYPTYKAEPDKDNNIFTRQDGQRWTPPTPVEAHNCYSNGERRCYDGHSGVDYSMAYERVLAAADGRVLRAEWYEPECYDDQPTCLYGLMIEIEHDIDGNNTTDYITLYGHLSATAVTAGEKVVAGQVIGTSGKTGNITGAHLHFQVMLSNRRAVDPYGWNAPAGTPDPWSTHANGAVSWCMWINAGSACTPPTLAPPPEYETITIDHPNLAFTKGCSWGGIGCWTLISAGQGGSSWATNLAQLNDWARWQPPFNTQAVYEVRVQVPNYGIRTYEARYEVQSVAGLKSNLRISQHDTSDADRWYSLGTYMFQSGFGGYVKVIDHLPQGSTNDRLLLADAVRFVRISNPPTPTPTRTAPPSRTPTHTPTITFTYTPTPGPTQPCPLSENGNNPPCTPTPSLTPTPTPTLSSTPTSVPPTTTPGGSMYFVQPATVEGIGVLFNETPPVCSGDANSIQCSGTFPHSWANYFYGGVYATFSYHQAPAQAVGFFFTATASDAIANISLVGTGDETDMYHSWTGDDAAVSTPITEVRLCFGGRYSAIVPSATEYNHFSDQTLFPCDYIFDRTAASEPVTYFNSDANTLKILAQSQFEGLPHVWSFTVHDFGYLLYGLPPTPTPTATPTNTPVSGTYTPLAPALLPTGTSTLVP